MIQTTATNGVHHATDEAIDVLYSFWPGTTPAPQPCPEALFSLTLKGKLDGVETLLTVRGQTPAAFKAHLQAIRGLLDPVPVAPAPSPPQGKGKEWCAVHNTVLHLNHGKDGRTWYSHKLPEGGFCKGVRK
jgi:hypothetical protein